MSSPGRNQPCPCGSGRPFADCCGRPGASEGASIRDCALTKLLAFAFHPAFDSDHSIAEFLFWGNLIREGTTPELRWLLESEDATIKYNSWFLFDWEIESAATVAQIFLQEEHANLSPAERQFMEEMIKRGLSLGGEQSGHVIFSRHLFTGDGIVTALSVLRVMADTGRELADLAGELVTYPQVLLNVRVREKRDLQTVPAVADAMKRVEDRLAGNGRLLVRYSGTEPLLRVMIEGQDQQEIQGWATQIVNTVKEHLG